MTFVTQLTNARVISFRTSCTISAPSQEVIMLSREYRRTALTRRAGCPNLSTLVPREANLSTRLSTATFDGAQANTCGREEHH